MGSEIARNLGAYYVFCLPSLILVALMSHDVIPSDTRVHVLPLIVSYIIIIDVNVISRRAWGPQQSSKPLWRTQLSTRLAPRTYRTVAVHTSMAASESCASTVDPSKLDSSLRMMKSPPLNAAFALYVEKALCYESYKFLQDATAYAEAVYPTPVEQVKHCIFCASCMCMYSSVRACETVQLVVVHIIVS
jgi:hypothetical protein